MRTSLNTKSAGNKPVYLCQVLFDMKRSILADVDPSIIAADMLAKAIPPVIQQKKGSVSSVEHLQMCWLLRDAMI